MKNLSGFIVGPGALLVMVFFFLPWFTISCSNVEMQASGFDMATGESRDKLDEFGEEVVTATGDFSSSFDAGFESESDGGFTEDIAGEGTGDISINQNDEEAQELEADPMLWGILLVAVVALGLIAVRFMDVNLYPAAWAGTTYIVLGGVGLVIQFIKYLGLEDNIADPINDAASQSGGFVPFEFSYEAGFYLVGLGLLIIIVGGIIAFFEPKEAPVMRPAVPDAPMPWEQ